MTDHRDIEVIQAETLLNIYKTLDLISRQLKEITLLLNTAVEINFDAERRLQIGSSKNADAGTDGSEDTGASHDNA